MPVFDRPSLGPDDIARLVREQEVKFINLQFTDIWGMVKSITIPSSQLSSLLKSGVWFDGSSVEGFARIAESDMYLKPDLDTFNIIPWERGENTTARVICNVHATDGAPFRGDPRNVLLRVLAEAEEMGFRYVTAPE
ncbi:glutamine synthetase beta-grasp domain-containing protein, partial [candidate division WOR-3 bacterium]|nr:glutamine synthetase beta-grasp domain-containing protein [candidate division WOR-3 bacterium]